MTVKTLPIHELKYYHGENKGFVFRGATPVSDEGAIRLAENILKWTAANGLPEIFRIDTNTVAFSYDDETDFAQAQVYQASRRFLMMGFFELDTLAAWLRDKN